MGGSLDCNADASIAVQVKGVKILLSAEINFQKNTQYPAQRAFSWVLFLAPVPPPVLSAVVKILQIFQRKLKY